MNIGKRFSQNYLKIIVAYWEDKTIYAVHCKYETRLILPFCESLCYFLSKELFKKTCNTKRIVIFKIEILDVLSLLDR
jgi:hypothetical protein